MWVPGAASSMLRGPRSGGRANAVPLGPAVLDRRLTDVSVRVAGGGGQARVTPSRRWRSRRPRRRAPMPLWVPPWAWDAPRRERRRRSAAGASAGARARVSRALPRDSPRRRPVPRASAARARAHVGGWRRARACMRRAMPGLRMQEDEAVNREQVRAPCVSDAPALLLSLPAGSVRRCGRAVTCAGGGSHSGG